MFGKRKKMKYEKAAAEETQEKLTLKQKISKAVRSLSRLCLCVRTSTDISFKRCPEAAPGRTFRFGTEKTVNIGKLILVLISVAAAFTAGVMAVRTAFGVAVALASKKALKSKK